jgi:SAM-dependent methyltransferase
MAEETEKPQATDEVKHNYVTLTFDHPVTDEEVKQMQMQHRAISAAHTVDQQVSRPDWYHVDNGFTSLHAMVAQHGPLVDVARDCLASVSGHVLDLGCGNGALLGKMCKDREDLVPCGVDLNAVAIEHAQVLFPEFADNFEQRDIFDPLVWSGPRRYALALLMAGRLKEVSASKASALLACLVSRCDRVLLYVYPSWKGESLENIVRQSGLRFEYSLAGVACIVVTDVSSLEPGL